VLRNLASAGDEGYHAAQYLYAQNVDFDNLTSQNGTGAAWQLGNKISFPDNKSLPAPNDPLALGLIAHEAMHLEQTPLVALTAYGELQAWQVGMRVTMLLNPQSGNPLGSVGDQINKLPLNHNPINLAYAVYLMNYQQNKPNVFGPAYPNGPLLFFTINPYAMFWDLLP
jgi:hypothetical protein